MNKKEKALRSGKKQPAEVFSKVTVGRSKGSGIPSKDSRYKDQNLGKDNQHNRDISSRYIFPGRVEETGRREVFCNWFTTFGKHDFGSETEFIKNLGYAGGKEYQKMIY